MWIQRSLEPGVGGHIRFRPLSWVGVELSTDHFFTVDQPLARRDHIVGADLFRGFAEEIGLDMAAYDAAVADPATAERVELDFEAQGGVWFDDLAIIHQS